jgi:hypothetical protein
LDEVAGCRPEREIGTSGPSEPEDSGAIKEPANVGIYCRIGFWQSGGW